MLPVFPRPQLLALPFAFLGTVWTVKAVGPPGRDVYKRQLVDYVKECRPLLNQGEPLPEPPQLSDFDKSLQNYKEQVQAEVAQEAKAAGLTVEEYIASGSDAPAQPNFSIYQVPRLSLIHI